ncbi:hypothetical protein TcasGA2_TC013904 [Tribolium castaneum]|uniref:Uncharacterized protein n=1 Tax=Tribolium castaneum TaxID=7070 RepID=D6WMP4_TRICA|nr:hypothetical protein TcasGA2_TC013904 [Tribolium castaneum]
MKMEVFDDIWKQENRTSNTVPGNCGNTKSTRKRFTRTFALKLEEYFFMKLDSPAAQFLVLSPVGSIEIILKVRSCKHSVVYVDLTFALQYK